MVVAPASMVRGDQLREEIDVAAGGILGGELDVVHIAARLTNGRSGLVECLSTGHLELDLEMQVGAGEKGMDAGTFGKV